MLLGNTIKKLFPQSRNQLHKIVEKENILIIEYGLKANVMLITGYLLRDSKDGKSHPFNS